MKEKSHGKFAYVICDPGHDEGPLLSSENLQHELNCVKSLNLVLAKVDAKANPTSIAVKYLKFLKENYFYLSTTLNIYDVNKFVRDHYLFMYAFSEDACYENIESFQKSISNQYGNSVFIPFGLTNDTAERLVMLSKAKEFLANLYSEKEINDKQMQLANDLARLFQPNLIDKFGEVIDYKKRSSNDIQLLIEYCEKQSKLIITNGWF